MNEDIYKKLVTLLKLFKNRPYHLAKYLIDNKALNKDFIKTVLNSNKLEDISNNEDLLINFNSIEQMEEFYSSLVDLNNLDNKTPEQISEELNLKLDSLIDKEKYEEAANLRDYMKRKKIERK
jgi:anaerobic selenocysteine-containing dehydrogenase